MTKLLHFAGGALLFAFFLLVPYALSSKVSVGQDAPACAYTVDDVVLQLGAQGIEFAVTEDPTEIEALKTIAAIATGVMVEGDVTRAIVANIQGYMLVGFEVNGCLGEPVNLGPMQENKGVDPSMFGPLYSPFAEHHA